MYLPVLEILMAVGVSRLAGPGLLASATRHGPTVVWVAVAFVAADLLAYWTHRCLHGRALWPVHRLHHVPRVLDWLSGFRFHPIDAAIEQAVPVLPLVALGFPPVTIAPYVIVVGLVVAYAHADISIPESRLTGIIVTPAYHRTHHAAGGTGTNFALVLPVMDRIFKTTAPLQPSEDPQPTSQRSTSRPTANDSPLAT